MADVLGHDIAGHLFAFEYCNRKIKGKPTIRKTKQSLSCFDQTLPVPFIRRPGRHEFLRIKETDLPYWASSNEYRYRLPRKTPRDYTKKGDGERVKRGELRKPIPKPKPPSAWGFRPRDNPPNTLFRKLYERGDLPLQVDHLGAKIAILWRVDVSKLDYNFFLPLFFDGIREVEDPYRFLAIKGVEDMLKVGEGKITNVIPQLIVPIKNALNTRNRGVINVALQLLCKLVMCEDEVGELLVPYYRQLLPVLNMFKSDIPKMGDLIDYGQQKGTCTGELVMKTLHLLETYGGPHAFINIKYMIPTYESCVF